MYQVFFTPVLLTVILTFILGFIFGQSIDLGWGLALGTSLTAFIAGLGLVATIYHSYAIRKHNRLLVKPHVTFDQSFSSDVIPDYYTYEVKAKNVGLGPAIIQKYTPSFKDAPEDLDPHTVFDELVKLVNNTTPAKGKSRCEAYYLYSGHALDKGEEKVLISISLPKEEKAFFEGREMAMKLAKKIDIEISYKCHYGSKYLASNKKKHNK